jgi:hypothetical protein
MKYEQVVRYAVVVRSPYGRQEAIVGEFRDYYLASQCAAWHGPFAEVVERRV